ncbi:MAG: fibronectin type III domain-containing protein [Desulfobacteraceae bacterium]|jgi:hypothetical protein|nr:fibronectin type III domain-containing protein [Desulfobacteraceae bacterium]
MINKLYLTILAVIMSTVMALSFAPLSLAATLRWTPSKGKVDGYKVYWGRNKKKPTESRNVGKRVAFNLNKLPLKEGVTYYISVSAYNTAGESKRSATVVFTQGDNTPPAPPQVLRAK